MCDDVVVACSRCLYWSALGGCQDLDKWVDQKTGKPTCRYARGATFLPRVPAAVLEKESELKCRLQPDVLETLVLAIKLCGRRVDHYASSEFVDWCHNVAGRPTPNLDPYEF